MRMRKKPNLIPRMQACERVLVREPDTFRGRWLENIPAVQLHVELGCGKGRFTVDTAASMPGNLLVAIEKVPDAMVVAMERACQQNLDNVRFIDTDAALMRTVFEDGEADRIYINFCDPWPSKRHAKRRLTSPLFLEVYKAVLKDGGEIHFKTDNQPLFDYSLEQFEAAGFILTEVSRNLHANGPVGIMTDYEAKFHAEGLPIYRCVARRGEA